MGTGLTPYQSEKLAKEFAKQMTKPWYVYQEIDYVDHSPVTYQNYISDDDFTSAFYEDAGKFFSKSANKYEGFDIRDVLRERLIYFMIDEELHYLLTGEFLDKSTINSVNVIRKIVGLKPLKKITKEQAKKNRLAVPIEKLPSWFYYYENLMSLEPYSKVSKAEIDKLRDNRKKNDEDDRIRHKVLLKNPAKLRSEFGL